MGMASSQARLLSLTARQHDIELKSQQLCAKKIQLANDYSAIYSDYETALNTTRIQAKVNNIIEGDTFQDATLAMLTNAAIPSHLTHLKPKNGVYAKKPLFLQDITSGGFIITKEYAKHLGIKDINDDPIGNISLNEYLTDVLKLDKTEHGILINDNYDNNIQSFTGIKGSITNPTNTYSGYTPVESKIDVYNPTSTEKASYGATAVEHKDTSDTTKYASIQNLKNTIDNGGTIDKNLTYTIDNMNDLWLLSEMCYYESGANKIQGVNFILNDNIDLDSNNSYDWEGIKYFKGTFDGNGYTISNFRTEKGFFRNTDGATIKNLTIYNAISHSSTDIEDHGILVGYAENTNIENITIKNSYMQDYMGGNYGTLVGYANDCNISKITILDDPNSPAASSQGNKIEMNNAGDTAGGVVGSFNVENSGSITDIYCNYDIEANAEYAGGIIGKLNVSNTATSVVISDIKYEGNVSNIFDGTSTNNTGGFAGSINCTSNNIDMEKIFINGTVTGEEDVGGFAGEVIYHVNNSSLELNDISVNLSTLESLTNSENVGGMVGYAKTGNTYNNVQINFNNSNNSSPIDNIVGTTAKNNITINMDNTTKAVVPSINADGTGGLYSNIRALLVKSGVYDPEKKQDAALENKIKTFIKKFSDTRENNKKLYYLNEKISEYLKTSAPNGTQQSFANSLYNDIKNGTTTTTNNIIPIDDIIEDDWDIVRSTSNDSWSPACSITKGEIEIPSLDIIADEIVYASNMINGAKNQIDRKIVIDYLEDYYDTTKPQDTGKLAKINELLIQFGENGSTNKNKIEELLSYIEQDKGQYNAGYPSEIEHSIEKYNIKIIKNREVQFELKGTGKNPEDYAWDWTDSAVKDGVTRYNILKAGVVAIIGDDSLEEYESKDAANNPNWLTNIINAGIAQFVEINVENTNVSYSDYVPIKLTATNVASDMTLQEVHNMNAIATAEQIYESKVKDINKKESKIDMELSVLDAERTAIKTETESLKRVAKDNIDMSFKLFS